MPGKEAGLRQRVVSYACRELGWKHCQVISETGGYANDVWRLAGRGQEVLVKVRNIPEEDPRQADGYVRGHALMASHGYPTPRLLALDREAADFEGRQVSILQFWPGRSLADLTAEAGVDANVDHIELFGAITAELHAIPVGSGVGWIDDAGGLHTSWQEVVLRTIDIAVEEVASAHPSVNRADQITQLANEAADRLRELASSLTLVRPSLVHRDLHLGNVLLSDASRPFVIDFEMVREWDPMIDLVKALSTLGGSAAATEVFLRAYDSVRPLQDDWRWRLFVYRGLGQLLNVADLLDGNSAYRSSPDSLRSWLRTDLTAAHD